MIGIVRACIDTPYSSLMRQYNHRDFDIIGIYYEQEFNVSMIFYDVYSSRRIPSNISIGNILCWESTVKVDSERYEISEEVEEVIVTSLLLANDEPEKGLDLFLSSGRSLILDKIHSYELYGRYYESTRYDRANMPGVEVAELDNFYKEIHSNVFVVLCERSARGILPFPKFKSPPHVENKLEKKIKHAITEKTFVVHVDREEFDLGEEPFAATFALHYMPKEDVIDLPLDHFVLKVCDRLCDLRLVELKSLYELLHYMETLPHDSYPALRKSLLEEMALRNKQ